MSKSPGDDTVQKYWSSNRAYPFKANDFVRTDESSDDLFYGAPRFVTHIDDAAIAALEQYYDRVLPGGVMRPNSSRRLKPRILDLCSSWTSHYPASVIKSTAGGKEGAFVEIFGLGMNRAELEKNSLFGSGARIVWDLNAKPWIPAMQLGLKEADPSFDPAEVHRESNEQDQTAVELEEWEKLDSTTITVSLDYLTSPLQVLKSIRSFTKTYGTVHVIVSNRCFPTKAVARWLRASERERLVMCAEDLWWSGWSNIEWEKLAPLDSTTKQPVQSDATFAAGDPLWVVRGINPD